MNKIFWEVQCRETTTTYCVAALTDTLIFWGYRSFLWNRATLLLNS